MDMLDDYEFECQYGDLCIEDLGCYYNKDEGEPFPLDYANIQEHQSKDAELQRQLTTSNKFAKKKFTIQNKVFELVTREGKICIPKGLQQKTVEWYHNILLHPGEKRTELTIGQLFYWKNMKTTVKNIVSRCPTCQLTKPKQQKFGI